MTPRSWLIFGAAVLVLGVLGYAYLRHRDEVTAQAQRAAVLQATSQMKGQIDALTQESATHKALANQAGQKAADQDKVIADLKGKLARVKYPSSSAGPAAVPPEPAGMAAEPGADQLKDELIEALDKQNGALKVENSELRLALEAEEKALETSERRAEVLKSALVKMPAMRTRAVGVIYGPKTKGISAEVDMGPLRFGLDVAQRPNEFEAMARVMWRF